MVFRLVAAVVLLIFAGLAATDAVCCPDGCTNEQQTSKTTEDPLDAGTCMLCLGGIDASITPILATCGRVSDDVVRLTFVAPDNITLHPLDHPPRS